jgi:hypothetical protein
MRAALLALAACASTPPPTGPGPVDQSEEVPFAPGVVVTPPEIPPARPETAELGPHEIRGRIVETRADGAVVLSGIVPQAERTLSVKIAPPLAVPFGVGDTIIVQIWRAPVPPPNAARVGISITDANGVLLYASVPDPAMLGAGWKAERGPLVRYSTEGRTHVREWGLVVSHGGRTAVVRPPRWRRLDTPDGRFYISGMVVETAYDPMPDGQVVPDERAGSDLSVTIVRA